MKATVNIVLLIFFLLPVSLVPLINLFGNTRHVVVKMRHDHGVVIINAKKVRVPYIIHETAIPTRTDGVVEFLFLNNYSACLVTDLTQLIMSLTLIFIYYLNTFESWLRRYRAQAFKTLLLTLAAFILSEICSNYVYQDWIIDTKNGINGNGDLFGVSSTSLNIATWSLNLDFQFNMQLYVIPSIALAVIVLDAKRRKVERLNYNLDGETP